MTVIGALTLHTARDLWPDEARYFNPWLGEHLDVLDHALEPLSLSAGSVQQPAGNLWVDIVALSGAGHTACIEAQFGATDHDHLGKLLTYIAAYDARIAVWIAEEPKPEHVNTVSALNARFNNVDFYLLRLEVVSIGPNAVKAPLFSRVVGPSPVIRTVREFNEQQAELRATMYDFWTGFIPLAADVVPAFKAKQPAYGRWCVIPAGREGIVYHVSVRQHDAECVLTIYGGSYGESQPVLAELQLQQAAIEHAFGGPLDWISGTRSHVRVVTKGGGYLARDQWPKVQAQLTETMGRLVRACSPALSSLASTRAFDKRLRGGGRGNRNSAGPCESQMQDRRPYHASPHLELGTPSWARRLEDNLAPPLNRGPVGPATRPEVDVPDDPERRSIVEIFGHPAQRG